MDNNSKVLLLATAINLQRKVEVVEAANNSGTECVNFILLGKFTEYALVLHSKHKLISSFHKKFLDYSFPKFSNLCQLR